jgi:general secretion pathway protein G
VSPTARHPWRVAIVGGGLACGLAVGCQGLYRLQQSILKEDLAELRGMIAEFRRETGLAPVSLDELVVAGYLRAVPQDPITRSTETWVLVREGDADSGIVDVRSGSSKQAPGGIRYCDW